MTATPSADVVYQQLYDAHAGQVLSYLNNQLRDYETAQDVSQQTWINVLRGLPGTLAKGQGVSKAWVMRLATNAMIDHLRMVKARPQTSDLDDALGPGTAFPAALLDGETPESVVLADAASQAQRSLLGGAMVSLPSPLSRALWLHYQGALSIADLAATLDRTDSGAKSALYRARLVLRAVVQNEAVHIARGRGVLVRLHEHIDKSAGVDACWPWTGTCLPRPGRTYPVGHGTWYVNPLTGRYVRPSRPARRLLWATLHGPLTPWEDVGSTCASQTCMNPAHLIVAPGLRTGKRVALRDAPTLLSGAIPDTATLRARRVALGLTQQQVGEAIGYSLATITEMEALFVAPVPRDARDAPRSKWRNVSLSEGERRLGMRQRVHAYLSVCERQLARVGGASGEAISRRRKALGLSLERCAAAAGISPCTLWRIEHEWFRPDGNPSQRDRFSRRTKPLALAALDRLEAERQEQVAA